MYIVPHDYEVIGGYRTIDAPLEAMPLDETYDAIVCAQTMDHLCDPVGVLRTLRSVGTGWLWADVTRSPLKIDHPFYFQPLGFQSALEAAGWRIVTATRMGYKLGVLAR